MPLKIKKTASYSNVPKVSRRLRKKWIWQLVISFWACVIIWALMGSNSDLGTMTRNFITESLSPQNDWMPAIEEVLNLDSGESGMYEQMVLPVSGIVSEGFGWSMDKTNEEQIWHGGIDIKTEKVQPVKAAAAGMVEEISGDLNNGYRIIVKHNQELTSVYGNLARVRVKKEQQVKQGEIIGETGKREMHFEIRIKGTPVDPLNYLRSKNQNV
jgi:murein DD-endopeptidase MepM/ murein hydrolase activator NlpD